MVEERIKAGERDREGKTSKERTAREKVGLSNRVKEERKDAYAHGKDKGVLHMHAHARTLSLHLRTRAHTHSRTLTHAHLHSRTFNCVITSTCTSTRT